MAGSEPPRESDFLIVAVPGAGIVLAVVLFVAELGENGVVDGVYGGLAVVTLFIPVIIELVLLDRRNRAREDRKLPD